MRLYASPRRSTRRRFLVSLALTGSALLVSPVSTLAYDGNAAAQWADNYAIYANCAISPCFTNDCTGFVSQAMHFGGAYPYYGVDQNIHDDHYWWLKNVGAGFGYSDSWAGINHLYYFEGVHIPGGTNYGGVVPGWQHLASSGLVKGDLLFYDWTSNGIDSTDHVGMMVGSGTDPSNTSWAGDWVDAHSNSHYHAFWTLAPYNSYVLTTKIYRMHIYATN